MCFGWCSLLVPGFQFDYVFDWTILKYQQSQIATPVRVIVSDGVPNSGIRFDVCLLISDYLKVTFSGSCCWTKFWAATSCCKC